MLPSGGLPRSCSKIGAPNLPSHEPVCYQQLLQARRDMHRKTGYLPRPESGIPQAPAQIVRPELSFEIGTPESCLQDRHRFDCSDSGHMQTTLLPVLGADRLPIPSQCTYSCVVGQVAPITSLVN